MKKILAMVAVALMTAVCAQAQDQKHEIGVFYGTGSASEIGRAHV